MTSYKVRLVTDGNLTFFKTVSARNPAAAWEEAVRRVERESEFEVDSGDVHPWEEAA